MDNILGIIRKNLNMVAISVSVIAALFLSVVDIKNPLFSIGIIIGIALVWYMTKNPINALIMFICLHPFSGMTIVDTRIGGITGLKVFNIVSILIVFIFIFLNKTAATRKSDKILIFGVIILLAIAIIRSIPYLSQMSEIWQDDLSLSRYLETFLLKSIFIFLPTAIIVFYVRGEEMIKKVTYGIIGSLMLLSLGLIIVLVFLTPDKSNFEFIRGSFQNVFNLHGNDLADFYITIYPVILAIALNKKSKIMIACLIISLITVGILSSRTAYLIIILSTILFLIISKRIRLLPYILIIGIAVVLFLPSSIKDRALTGLQDGSSMDQISAGRTDNVWLPLINEYLKSPVKMLIGDGRFSITHTQAYKTGLIYKVEHAHNIYLDTILDTGILGLAFFLGMFIMYIGRFAKAHKDIRGSPFLLDLLRGIEISMIAFLISGFTGRVFFPVYLNSYTWIVVALGIAIINTNNSLLKGEKH